MKRSIVLLLPMLGLSSVYAQPPSVRVPERWTLSFDTAQFFEDLDTTRTTIDVNPKIYSTSYYPNGRTIVLDLLTPSINGMEFNFMSECDQPYVDLLGGELLEGGVVMHFHCGEGWSYTVVITEWSPLAKVVLYRPADEGVMGMIFNAKLTIEPIEIAEEVGR